MACRGFYSARVAAVYCIMPIATHIFYGVIELSLFRFLLVAVFWSRFSSFSFFLSLFFFIIVGSFFLRNFNLLRGYFLALVFLGGLIFIFVFLAAFISNKTRRGGAKANFFLLSVLLGVVLFKEREGRGENLMLGLGILFLIFGIIFGGLFLVGGIFFKRSALRNI